MKRPIPLLIALVLTFAACGGETGADIEVDTSEAIEEIEAGIRRIGDRLVSADVDEDVRTAWESAEAELTRAVESLRTDATIDADAIQEELDGFEQRLESVDVDEDLRQAWEELRTNFQNLINQMSG